MSKHYSLVTGFMDSIDDFESQMNEKVNSTNGKVVGFSSSPCGYTTELNALIEYES